MRFLSISILLLIYTQTYAYEFKKNVDPITDEVTAAALFSSQDGKYVFSYACEHGKPMVIAAFSEEINTANPFASIIFRFDKKEPIEVKNSTLMPSKPNSDVLKAHHSFMKELAESRLVAVRMNTMLAALLGLAKSDNAATGVFEIDGISQAIKRVNSTAGCPQISDYSKLISAKTSEEQQIELQAEEKEKQAAIDEHLQKEQDVSEKALIMAAIQQKVDANWLRPPNTPNGLSCDVRARLGLNGSVLLVTVTRSSGHEGFDRSVEAAVRKADPLPMPTSPNLIKQFRDIHFVFKPQS